MSTYIISFIPLIDQFEDEEMEMSEPVSPMGQYFNSSVLSVSIIAILEFDNPFDDSESNELINKIFLPINPRFSSIMAEDENGEKYWKRVEVKVDEHVKVPRFPDGLSVESYNDYFDSYISNISSDPFPPIRPLWEIHVIKFPTINASGSLIFKLHHSLGDGYSLMGALLSCLKRADNPSVPLSFPNVGKSQNTDNYGIKSMMRLVPQAMRFVLDTVSDFGSSVLKSSFVEDNRTPIRSGEYGMEFQPVNIKTITFSLDRIKQVKANLQVTINDVVAGAIFLGTRLYMETTSSGSGKARSTSLVLLNTRAIGGYKSVDEMLHNPEAQNLWGNQFAFLHVSLPKLHQSHDQSLNPLKFVHQAHSMIKKKRNSWAVYVTGHLLESIRKYRGQEAAATYVHRTIHNSSMALTNMVGPTDKMSLSNQTVKGVYFMVVNAPLDCVATVMSYTDQLRIALGTKNNVIDPLKLRSCIHEAFDMIFKAALDSK